MKKAHGVFFALAALGLVTLVAGSSSAAPATTGEPFVREMMGKVSYRKLSIAVASMDMVEPMESSTGPRLIDWVRSEQARGRAVLVPAGYYSGTMNVSPSQIVSTDEATSSALEQLGVFKKLPKGF